MASSTESYLPSDQDIGILREFDANRELQQDPTSSAGHSRVGGSGFRRRGARRGLSPMRSGAAATVLNGAHTEERPSYDFLELPELGAEDSTRKRCISPTARGGSSRCEHAEGLDPTEVSMARWDCDGGSDVTSCAETAPRKVCGTLGALLSSSPAPTKRTGFEQDKSIFLYV